MLWPRGSRDRASQLKQWEQAGPRSLVRRGRPAHEVLKRMVTRIAPPDARASCSGRPLLTSLARAAGLLIRLDAGEAGADTIGRSSGNAIGFPIGGLVTIAGD